MSMIPRTACLSIPAPQRLAMLRLDFETHAIRYPNCLKSVKPASWRDMRTSLLDLETFHGALSEGKQGKDRIWATFCGPEFRNEHRHETGWYTDNHQESTAHGIVAGLTHGRFIAGYIWEENGERVYFDKVHDDFDDAMHLANEHARVFAEFAVEDDLKRSEAMEAQDKLESTLHRLREMLALRNVKAFTYARPEAWAAVEKARELKKEIAEIHADCL